MKNKILIIITAIIIIIAICVLLFISKDEKELNNEISNASVSNNVNNTVTTNSNQVSQSKTMEANLNENGDVEIKLDDLDVSNATFINYNSDGTNVELVAIKDSQDNVSIAFNTCQVCNGSPKAYFVQKNGKLICQNCRNTFSLNSIGSSSYGCNPMTISDKNITKTDTGIIISKEYLAQNKNLFTNVAEH